MCTFGRNPERAKSAPVIPFTDSAFKAERKLLRYTVGTMIRHSPAATNSAFIITRETRPLPSADG